MKNDSLRNGSETAKENTLLAGSNRLRPNRLVSFERCQKTQRAQSRLSILTTMRFAYQEVIAFIKQFNYVHGRYYDGTNCVPILLIPGQFRP